MPRQSQYSEAEKSKIIQAAIAAKAKGKWSDALDAAKAEGYKGGLPYLVTMVRGKGKPKKTKAGKRGRPKGSKNRTVRRGPGRPPRSASNGVVRRGPGRPPKSASNGSGLGQINGIVKSMVQQQTRDVLRNALAALKQATRAVERAL